jgi:hypothetical protein
MTLAIEEFEELHELIGELCDGAIDAGRFTRLEAMLADDDEAQRFYVRYLDIHGTLRRLCIEEEVGAGDCPEFRVSENGTVPLGPRPLEPRVVASNHPTNCRASLEAGDGLPARPRSVPRLSWGGMFSGVALSYASAALVLGVGLVAAWAWMAHGRHQTAAIAHTPIRSPYGDLEGRVVAKIVAADGCRWADPRDFPNFRTNDNRIATFAERKATIATSAERKATIPLGPRAGEPLAIGRRLALASGTLKIVYASGVELTIAGPAEFVVDRCNGGDLRLGKATVRAFGKGLATAGGTPAPHDAASAAELLAAAQQVQRYHRTRFSLRTARVVVIESGGDFGLSVTAAGEVRADILAGRLELWYPQGVTSQDTLGGGHFWGYATEDSVRGGFRAVCQVGDAPLSVKMEMAGVEHKNRGVFVSAEAATPLDEWRARSRLEGEKTRSGMP